MDIKGSYSFNMNLFFASNIQGKTVVFDEEESRHIAAVLRLRAGQELHITDGKGNLFKAVLLELGKKSCTASITEILEQSAAEKYPNVHIAIAPTKSTDRFEWFLEKATETGVTEITPLLCERSERKVIRPDRLEKLMIAGMKQSLNLHLPKLHPMKSFDDFIRADFSRHQRFIGYLGEALPHLLQQCRRGLPAIIMIGPEGDFSTAEIEKAKAAGFEGVSLGDSRFRTETAGVLAAYLMITKTRFDV